MRKTIFLLIMGIIFFQYSSSPSYELYRIPDSVKITLTPEYLEPDSDPIVNLRIENGSEDTLLIINEFYLQGVSGNILVYPMFYSPNILVLKDTYRRYLEGDGSMEVNYNKFPSMLVIPPSNEVIIEIGLSVVKDSLTNKSWDLFTWSRLAVKSHLESIIKNKHPELMEEYYDALLYEGVVEVVAKYGGKYDFKQTKTEYYNIIEEVFKK